MLNIYELAALVVFFLSRKFPGRVRVWLQTCHRRRHRAVANSVVVGRTKAWRSGESRRQGDRRWRVWQYRDSQWCRINPDEEEEG